MEASRSVVDYVARYRVAGLAIELDSDAGLRNGVGLDDHASCETQFNPGGAAQYLVRCDTSPVRVRLLDFNPNARVCHGIT